MEYAWVQVITVRSLREWIKNIFINLYRFLNTFLYFIFIDVDVKFNLNCYLLYPSRISVTDGERETTGGKRVVVKLPYEDFKI